MRGLDRGWRWKQIFRIGGGCHAYVTKVKGVTLLFVVTGGADRVDVSRGVVLACAGFPCRRRRIGRRAPMSQMELAGGIHVNQFWSGCFSLIHGFSSLIVRSSTCMSLSARAGRPDGFQMNLPVKVPAISLPRDPAGVG